MPRLLFLIPIALRVSVNSLVRLGSTHSLPVNGRKVLIPSSHHRSGIKGRRNPRLRSSVLIPQRPRRCCLLRRVVRVSLREPVLVPVGRHGRGAAVDVYQPVLGTRCQIRIVLRVWCLKSRILRPSERLIQVHACQPLVQIGNLIPGWLRAVRLLN